ncbi:MAG: hypothetical protein MK125_12350, partial [Dehalococcoidia bacterium]|nr:hypothetical protein [Dehalococcoidia bacterium]
ECVVHSAPGVDWPAVAGDHRRFLPGKGYSRIGLSTVGFLQPALAMYRRHDYTTVKEEPYGDPPHQPVTVHYLVEEFVT